MKQKDKDTFEDRIQCETIDEGNAGTIDRLLVNVSYMKSRKSYYLSVYPAGNSEAGSEYEVIHITQGGTTFLGGRVARFNAKTLAQIANECDQSIQSRSGDVWEFITKIALREGLKIKGWDDQDVADLKAIKKSGQLYEVMVAERMRTYNTTREVVERGAKAFWTTREEDDPQAFADACAVRAQLGGDSFTLDQFILYFATPCARPDNIAAHDGSIAAAHEALCQPPVNGRAEFVTAMTDLTHFMSRQQWQFVKQLGRGEEKQFFFDKMVELANLIAGMPQTYDQDGAGDDAFAYLHYFFGGCDWYITEKDKGSDDDEPQDRGKQHQAFGLADLGYGAELGYISIQDLLDNNVELDFHFRPKTIAEIKGRDSIVAVTAGAVHGVGAAV